MIGLGRLVFIVILAAIWAGGAQAQEAPRFQQRQSACLDRAQVLGLGSLLAEIELDTTSAAGAKVPRRMLFMGDPSTRDLAIWDDVAPPGQTCFRLRHSGYGWSSVADKDKKGSPDLSGVTITADTSTISYCDALARQTAMDLSCSPTFTFGAPETGGLLDKGDVLAAYMVVNMHWQPDGSPSWSLPTVWQIYRNRKNRASLVQTRIGKAGGFRMATGKLEALRRVDGSAAVVAEWQKHLPPLPRTPQTLKASMAADRSGAGACIAPSAARTGWNLVWQGSVGTKNPLPVLLQSNAARQWQLYYTASANCMVRLLEGDGLATADYVLDAYRQPVAFTNRYAASKDLGKDCEELSKIYQVVGGQAVDCNSLSGVIAAEAAVADPRGQAMLGYVQGEDGTRYEMALFASDRGAKAFRLYQAWPDGMARLALSGTGFEYAPALQQAHFAMRRRAAADAEAARQTAAQRARSEQQIAAEEAAHYKVLAAQEVQRLERERQARLTPKQRMDEHIRRENAKVLAYMDSVVLRDSRTWMFNRYKQGSMRNLQLFNASEDGRSFIARADYTFNKSVTGWVEFHFVNARLSCIEFWDSSCRPVGWTNANMLQALFGGL
ncbi:MAG: hypothetical protein H6918_05020 [Sphingomonadaceae bacterium]|nr:hypothetical protein [Sphingomonadaceae bacterium]